MRFAPITLALLSAFTLVIAHKPKPDPAEEEAVRQATMHAEDLVKNINVETARGPPISHPNALNHHSKMTARCALHVHLCQNALTNKHTPAKFREPIEAKRTKAVIFKHRYANLVAQSAMRQTKVPKVRVPDNLPDQDALASHHLDTAAKFRTEAELARGRALVHLERASNPAIVGDDGTDLAAGAKALAEGVKNGKRAAWHINQAKAVEGAPAVRAAMALKKMAAEDAFIRSQRPNSDSYQEAASAADGLMALGLEDASPAGQAGQAGDKGRPRSPGGRVRTRRR